MEIPSPASGEVIEVLAKLNSEVTEGDLICRIRMEQEVCDVLQASVVTQPESARPRSEAACGRAFAVLEAKPMKRTTGMDRAATANWRPATRALRGGTWRSEHGETSEALFLTSGYTYDDAQTVADRFAGTAQGMTYSRLQNPTVAMLEERIALMEGAEACRTQATRMAAMTAALLCQLATGDHVVAARCVWIVPLAGRYPAAQVRDRNHRHRQRRQCRVGGRDPAQHQGVLLRDPGQLRRSISSIWPMSAASPGRTASLPWSTMPSPLRCCSARWRMARMWLPIPPPS